MKADLRREITAWGALVWAYRHEFVRAAGDSQALRYADTDYAQSPMETEKVGGGLINGALHVHEDALAIDALVWRWFDGSAQTRFCIARHAERETPPPRQLDLVLQRIVPKYRPNGALWMEYPPRGRQVPYLCVLDYVGEPADVIEKKQRRQAELHALFLAMLDWMAMLSLSKWKIVGRGLTAGGESLTQGRIGCVLRSEA